MDHKIDKRKASIVQKVETLEKAAVDRPVHEGLHANVPLTLEEYVKRTNQALEAVREGDGFSTEEVMAYVKSGGKG